MPFKPEWEDDPDLAVEQERPVKKNKHRKKPKDK